jgi:lauroyl/myristoyl acyltransferase
LNKPAELERIVRRHPEQYFWLHRRWKHQLKEGARKKAAFVVRFFRRL